MTRVFPRLALLEGRLADFSLHRGRPVRTICHTDRRPSQAADLLRRHGFGDVRVVSGGMVKWKGRDYPVAQQNLNHGENG